MRDGDRQPDRRTAPAALVYLRRDAAQGPPAAEAGAYRGAGPGRGAAMISVGLRWAPPISCSCGQEHRPGARYYVSVYREPSLGPVDGNVRLALGPFLTHP